MFYPDIIYTVNPEKRKPGQQNIFQALGAVNEFMDLNYLEVIDGNIDLTIKKDLRMKLYRANLSIESNSLLSSKKIATIKNSLNSINFEKGKLLAGNLAVELNELRYIGNSGHFVAASISVQDKNKRYDFLIKDVEVDKMIVDEMTGNIDAVGIGWKKGNVHLDINDYKNSKAKSSVLLKHIKGENTTVNIIKEDLSINSHIDNISLDKLESQPGSSLILDGLKTKGSQLKVKSTHSDLSIGNYNISDNKTSTFGQVNFSSSNKKADIYFSAPSMSLISDIHYLLKKDIILENVIIEKPEIKLHLNNLAGQEKSALAKIKVSSLKSNQPQVDFSINDSSNTVFKWNGAINPLAFLEITDINTNTEKPGNSTIKEARFNMSDFEFGTNGKTFYSGKGNIEATVKNVELNAENKQTIEWNGYISDLKAKDFYADSIGNNKGNLAIISAEIKSLNISSNVVSNFKKIISDNNQFQLNRFTGNYKDPYTILHWKNAAFNRRNNSIKLDSFSYNPALARDSFLAHQNFQKDYITFKTGAIAINELNPDKFLQEDLLKATSIKIQNATFTDYKDKQIPFNPGVIKPLPVNLLKKIPFKVLVENIEIENGNVVYTETGIIADSPAIIPVTRLKIHINNVKNYNYLTKDTLLIDATGYLLDTALAHLMINESYNDANGGFILNFQVSPTDLTIINPVLSSLATVKVQSGFLDTISATVVGREAVAIGEIGMHYHDLKIKFPNGLKTFLANTFVIKKNSKSITGQIFHMRKRDRSAINYYVKIIGSGIASSIGAKNNKKQLKKFRKKNSKK